MTPDGPYLSPEEAVAYLRLPSVSQLYKLIREHSLPYRRRGRCYIFCPADLDTWTKGPRALRLQEQPAFRRRA